MSLNNRRGPTRRSFVRGAALGAAGLAAAGTPAAADTPPATNTPAPANTPAPKPPKLSKVTEAQVDALLSGPGARFSKEEKADVARLAAAAEKTGATLHAFPLEENADPALIFRVYRKGGN
jgi:hypothetical protein